MADFDHWMPLNVGDYLADTMHLTTLQHGIYVRLIMHYFKRGPLPNNEKMLARIAGLSLLIWRKSGPQVMALFRLENDAFLHTRIERVRAEAKRLVNRKRDKDRLRSQDSDDSRVQHNQPHNHKDSPPSPPEGGSAGEGRKIRGRRKNADPRNGFVGKAAEMIDDRENDPRIVPLRRVRS